MPVAMQSTPHPALLEWSNSIRLSMANDPGRQLFYDQVHTHGFLFLQDYLDNILSGTKQDPLIELVKTPGRKKVISKKPKVLSKLNTVVSLSSDESEDDQGNTVPINSFHKTLLKAKDDLTATEHAIPLHARSNPPQQQSKRGEQVHLFEDGVTTIVTPATIVAAVPTDQATSLKRPVELLIPSHEQNELSIIAEDDENAEHSRISIQPSSSYSSLPLPKNNISQASPKTSYIINLDSAVSPLSSTFVAAQTKNDPSPEDFTTPLPEIPDDTVTAPLSKPPTTSPPVPKKGFQASHSGHVPVETSPKASDSKSNISLFPALPAPMPLRKSMRAPRDPSIVVATPGTALGINRTSWLQKVREAKAMEGTGRNTNASTTVAGPSMLKRKSESIPTGSMTPGLEDEARLHKSPKHAEGDTAPLKLRISEPVQGENEEIPEHLERQILLQPQHPYTEQEGMLDRLKRTVEDLGARVGKSMAKSLGAGAAVSALAEARAAAEARVAERNYQEEEITRAIGTITTVPTPEETRITENNQSQRILSQGIGQRLSISDLFPPDDGNAKIKNKAVGKVFQATPPTLQPATINQNRESITTTPPDTPPTTSSIPLADPVFNKPPPVFIPPIPTSAASLKSTINPSSIIIASAISSKPPSLLPSPKHVPLSSQSTLESVEPDTLFDTPAWLPSTQDTEYSLDFGSQLKEPNTNALDEDDSWPMDEKLASGVQWTFGVGKEDSITWSTLPSQSQRADTGPQRDEAMIMNESEIPQIEHAAASDVDDNGSEVLAGSDSELEEMVMGRKPTSDLVEHKTSRSESQMSMASSASSQSQHGFLGQASKLLSSALGTSKKGKPEVKKVLQMAAAAAKKQQEENDKKAARLKEMDNRRQMAIHRKAEEEKARMQEQEKRLREEGERRKREREEGTDKRLLKMGAGGKKDEENTKKRKFTVEVETKSELKIPILKTTVSSSMKQPVALGSSAAYNSAMPKLVETKSSKAPTTKGKAPATKTPTLDDDLSQPSQLMQIQMAARAKAQLQAAKQAAEPIIQSESIELPDINSEYSDSEDEDRPRTFDPPGWAQSPELRQALQTQSTINPDDIFGAIQPLKMEELFRTRTARFRARTSSANWTGADRLTAEEEQNYARRMGFK